MRKSESNIYTEADLNELYRRVSLLRSDMSQASSDWLSVGLNETARNYVVHGFLRRASTLSHCIRRIFEVCPPENSEIDRDSLVDTTVFVQAFVFNAYGAIDNLCHVLNSQLSFELPNTQVGFGNNYKKFREKLSVELKNKTEELNPWFTYLSDYRHALGHRIPLYIPPLIIPENRADQYRSLNQEWHQALVDGNDTLANELDKGMKDLGSFHPFMTHSFLESHNQISFHIQVIEDWHKILELSGLALKEITGKL